VSSSPFEVRALIEGFYGVYYTHPERLSLLRFLARHGYNQYIYAPKNDRQHRARWRQPYPERQMERFAEAARTADELGIDFCYALSPGIDIRYSSEADFDAITAKLAVFHRLGVRHFSLLLDDIRREFPDPRDAESYPTFAAAHADLCNRLYAWLRRIDPECRLSMCPTDYHGGPPLSPALHELGDCLHPGIDVFYTGLEVCSPKVGRAEVDAFAAALGRRPILWDNYPVNDGGMEGELHVGPIRGRAADLGEALRGVAVNPMNQAEASKIVLATFGDYLREPHGYDPDASWERALREVAGDGHEAMRLVAETSLKSCLGTGEAERLELLAGAATTALEAELGDDPAVDELVGYLGELDEACYALRYRLENLELRSELLPWLEQLESWTWLGRWSVQALRAVVAAAERSQGGPGGRPAAPGGVEPTAPMAAPALMDPGLPRRIEEYLRKVDRHPKRIGGIFLRPLAELALERRGAREAA
jgi:hyaluronoglucosaminidase